MKQTNMMRWIETAEARSVWILAEEDPARASVAAAASSKPQAIPFVLFKLREQLCLGEAGRRYARFYRPRRAA
jgi:hypothetical protein